MIKGCTKRVIVVKDVQSDTFEEAYFILRPQSEKSRCARTETDIIREANRIVTEKGDAINPFYSHSVTKGRVSHVRDIVLFLCGSFFSAAIMAAVSIL